MTTTAYVIHPPRRTTPGAQGGAVRTFGRKPNNSQPPELPDDTRRMFEKISDPKNAHHFSVEALNEGLAHIKL